MLSTPSDTTAERTSESSDLQSTIDAWKQLVIAGKTAEIRQALIEVDGLELCHIWDIADTGFKVFPQASEEENIGETLSRLVSREMGRRDFEIQQAARLQKAAA